MGIIKSAAAIRAAMTCAAICTAHPATADEAEENSGAIPAHAAEPVKVTLQPYIWVPTLKGTASLGPVVAPVNVVPKDFADGFQIGGMGRLKVERGGAFVYLDTVIIDYDSRSFRPFFEQPLLSKTRYFDAGIGITRQVQLSKKRAATISPQVGVQHLYLLADVDGNLISARASGQWWSPAVGVAASIPASDDLSVELAANAAGFGLGRSNYQNAEAALKYRLGESWNVSAGYRITKGRFDSRDGLSIDLDGGGPMVAVAYDFALSH